MKAIYQAGNSYRLVALDSEYRPGLPVSQHIAAGLSQGSPSDLISYLNPQERTNPRETLAEYPSPYQCEREIEEYRPGYRSVRDMRRLLF